MIWRDDLDALQFAAGNGGNCIVHRLAFRVMRHDCIEFYEQNSVAFEAAAKAKIDNGDVHEGCNFHLNSRQIRNILTRGDWQRSCMTNLANDKPGD
ncbi:hypothetical protein A4U53_000335 (plasmid) [Rhizobium ruizarguesonis]|uniref:Uncharacterized protein n=1 Tax=Rhizobium ruizarguesonis TaxID=2081791 RepID=A0ACD5EF18_9HYPH|nr:hypothetical protein [Rhizobium leguminosarum]